MDKSKSPMMQFPCDCLSSNQACAESWARVAKEGMFKGGTREVLLNLLETKPMTIAQLASAARLSQPTIFRHMRELVKSGLVIENERHEKAYIVEKYYSLNFPVISPRDRQSFEKDVEGLAGTVAAVMERGIGTLKSRHGSTDSSADGWQFDVVAQYLFHVVQRRARLMLEKRGFLATTMKKANLDFVFWAQK